MWRINAKMNWNGRYLFCPPRYSISFILNFLTDNRCERKTNNFKKKTRYLINSKQNKEREKAIAHR